MKVNDPNQIYQKVLLAIKHYWSFFSEVTIVVTTFVRALIIVAEIMVIAVLLVVFAHARWYSSIVLGTVAVLGLWCFDVWQKDLVRRSAWLAIRASVLESREIERFRAAYSSGNLEETRVASVAVQAAIRELE
jgi:hypothetical protein